MQRIIDQLDHLTDEEKTHKRALEQNRENSEKLTKEIKNKTTHLEKICHEHFSDIRRKIDIEREEKKIKIDQILFTFIDKINQKETEIIEIIKSHASTADQYIEMPNMNDKFREQKINIEEIGRAVAEGKSKINVLHSILTYFDSIEKEIKSYDFKKNPEFKESEFGSFGSDSVTESPQSGTCREYNLENGQIIFTGRKRKISMIILNSSS